MRLSSEELFPGRNNSFVGNGLSPVSRHRHTPLCQPSLLDDDGDYDDDDGDDDDDYDDGHRHTPLSTKPSFLSHSKEKDGNSQNWKKQACVCWIFLNPLLRSILENLW